MKRILGLLVLALLSVSCFKGGYYETNYTGAATFNYTYSEKDFPDSVMIGSLADAPTYMSFMSNVSETEGFKGGFVFSMKRDSSFVIAQDNKYPNFTTYTNQKSINLPIGVVDGFLVYYDSPAKPERSALFAMASTGTCTPVYCMVTNTQPVVKYFLEEGSTAKENDDYLKLTVTGYLGGKKTGDTEYVLASADSVNVTWKTISLAKLGNIDAMDFSLESSNPDIPKYFCFDNFVTKIYIKQD